MAKEGRIVSRIDILIAEKAFREKRSVSRRTVATETGLARTTVDNLANDRTGRFDAPVLVTLCQYFGCDVGDILVYEEVEVDAGESAPEQNTPLAKAV